MKLSQILSRLFPKIEYKKVAMFYKGNRLIPICLMDEVGNEEPDAMSTYRRVMWFNRTMSCHMVEEPEILKGRIYVEENEETEEKVIC